MVINLLELRLNGSHQLPVLAQMVEQLWSSACTMKNTQSKKKNIQLSKKPANHEIGRATYRCIVKCNMF